MPAIHTARATLSWFTIFDVIGAATKAALGVKAANQSHNLPQPQPRHHHHHLGPRDPGTSNAKVGGAIVAALTVGIVVFVLLCLRSRDGFSRPSPHHSPSHSPSPTRSPKAPKIGLVVIPPVYEDEEPTRGFIRPKPRKTTGDDEPIFGFKRQKPPRPGQGTLHPPPVPIERVYLSERDQRYVQQYHSFFT